MFSVMHSGSDLWIAWLVSDALVLHNDNPFFLNDLWTWEIMCEKGTNFLKSHMANPTPKLFLQGSMGKFYSLWNINSVHLFSENRPCHRIFCQITAKLMHSFMWRNWHFHFLEFPLNSARGYLEARASHTLVAIHFRSSKHLVIRFRPVLLNFT